MEQKYKTIYLEKVTYVEESREVILEYLSDLQTRTRYATFVYKDVTEYSRCPAKQLGGDPPYEELQVIQGGGPPSMGSLQHHFIQHAGEEITFVSPRDAEVIFY